MKIASIAATLLLAAIAIAPPLIAIASSFGEAHAYRTVLDTYGDALFFSMKLATGVTLATLAIAVPAGYAFARHPFRGSRVVEQVAMLPLTLPGVTVAIALIVATASLRGHVAVLAAGQMLYTTAYVVAIVAGAVRGLALDDVDAAARTLGAHAWRRFRRVILPLIARPIAIAALIAFAISWGEFNVSFILATPPQMPFSAALYGTFTSSSPAVSGAATALFVAGALPFLAAIQFMDFGTADATRP